MYYLYSIMDLEHNSEPVHIVSVIGSIRQSKSLIKVLCYYRNLNDEYGLYPIDVKVEFCAFTFVEFGSGKIVRISGSDLFDFLDQNDNQIYSYQLNGDKFSIHVFNKSLGVFARNTELSSLAFVHQSSRDKYSVFSLSSLDLKRLNYRLGKGGKFLYFKTKFDELKLEFTGDFSSFEGAIAKVKLLEDSKHILD